MSNFVENPTTHEIPRSLTAAEFWDRRVSNMRFYHGTSSLSLSSIRVEGLSPNRTAYSRTDAKVLAGLSIRPGESKLSNYFYNLLLDRRVYVGTDFSTCVEHARIGSEAMREMLDQTSYLLEFKKGDPRLIIPIRERLNRHLARHKPVMLVINNDSLALRGTLEAKHPRLFQWWVNKDAFIGEARKDLQATSEEDAAWTVLDRMDSEFADIAIDKQIPPSDFQVIDADQFEDFVKSRGY